jgi:hypothetical protein
MAGFTASWVHGTAVVAEQPRAEDGALFHFNHYGWGTQINLRPGFGRWFHIPLPTPVMLDGQRMKLIRAFIQFSQIAGYPRSGSIQDVHLYDGREKVAAKSANDFKANPSAVIADHQTFELHQPRVWYFGAGLSFKLWAASYTDGHFIDNHDAPWIVIGSAGADFEVS